MRFMILLWFWSDEYLVLTSPLEHLELDRVIRIVGSPNFLLGTNIVLCPSRSHELRHEVLGAFFCDFIVNLAGHQEYVLSEDTARVGHLR